MRVFSDLQIFSGCWGDDRSGEWCWGSGLIHDASSASKVLGSERGNYVYVTLDLFRPIYSVL